MITEEQIKQIDNRYKDICLLSSKDDSYFNVFKSHPDYNVILEHVSYEMGKEYYYHCLNVNKQIFDNKSIDVMKKIDSLGSPRRCFYDGIGHISPTMLRYYSVMGDIERLYGSLDNKTIVEIGAGYGGQSMMIQLYHNVKKYIIVDLPEVIELIKTFLKKNNVDLSRYEFYSFPNIPEIESDFLISNYAFSECPKSVQDVYIDSLINKTKSFYMIINFMGGKFYTKEELLSKINGEIIITKEQPPVNDVNILFYKENKK
jgi:putative sugar O-methyltransferase